MATMHNRGNMQYEKEAQKIAVPKALNKCTRLHRIDIVNMYQACCSSSFLNRRDLSAGNVYFCMYLLNGSFLIICLTELKHVASVKISTQIRS